MQDDTTWENVHKAIVTECVRLRPVAAIENIQSGRLLLDKSNDALRRLFMLSYTYRITQKQQYLT